MQVEVEDTVRLLAALDCPFINKSTPREAHAEWILGLGNNLNDERKKFIEWILFTITPSYSSAAVEDALVSLGVCPDEETAKSFVVGEMKSDDQLSRWDLLFFFLNSCQNTQICDREELGIQQYNSARLKDLLAERVSLSKQLQLPFSPLNYLFEKEVQKSSSHFHPTRSVLNGLLEKAKEECEGLLEKTKSTTEKEEEAMEDVNEEEEELEEKTQIKQEEDELLSGKTREDTQSSRQDYREHTQLSRCLHINQDNSKGEEVGESRVEEKGGVRLTGSAVAESFHLASAGYTHLSRSFHTQFTVQLTSLLNRGFAPGKPNVVKSSVDDVGPSVDPADSVFPAVASLGANLRHLLDSQAVIAERMLGRAAVTDSTAPGAV